MTEVHHHMEHKLSTAGTDANLDLHVDDSMKAIIGVMVAQVFACTWEILIAP